jgi:hypothetical protein|tara:strand:+ start:161 stop:478 length:318 start_codon:yes stop_codon:yes gene_type:complete
MASTGHAERKEMASTAPEGLSSAPALDTHIPGMLENLEAAGNNLRAGVYSDFFSKGHAEGKEAVSKGHAEGKEGASTAPEGLSSAPGYEYPAFLAFGEAFYYIEA